MTDQPHAPTIAALSNGRVGVVGDVGVTGARATFVAGAYGVGLDGIVRPLPGAAWTDIGGDDGQRWEVDLLAGTLRRTDRGGRVTAERFASITRPSVAAVTATAARGLPWPAPLQAPDVPRALCADHTWRLEVDADGTHVGVTQGGRDAVVVAARQRVDGRRLERVVAVERGSGARARALRSLREASDLGVEHLLREHREAWGRRWAEADITIEGDDDAQLAVRFALFHLLSCARADGESIVGARGTTGLAYAGHVFWDAEAFVLPALAATAPAAARSVLRYRVNRLPAARARASTSGSTGARFPWESADTGEDVTPRFARDLDGTLVPISTGDLSEHINSDVAWASDHLLRWTGDESFLAEGGRALIVETAVHWLHRVRTDPDGSAHLDDVTGPDEYHERVDDDAYTNLMARWHLRRAAELLEAEGDRSAAESMRSVASALVDGQRPDGGHEQFAGFDALEEVDLLRLGAPPFAADIMLGRARTAGAKVLKQPNTLMAHHLLGDLLPRRSLLADLRAELPLVCHGSSLSPAICAAVMTRAGRPDEALALLDIAGRMDLDDLTGSTGAGLHLGTMGALWQAVVHGFAGVQPVGGELRIEPHLPSSWESILVRVTFRGEPVQVRVDRSGVGVEAAAPVPLRIGGRSLRAPAHHAYGPSAAVPGEEVNA